MKYTPPSGSNPSNVRDDDLVPNWYLAGQTDDDCEYFREIDVCADQDFWWDEEDRHVL